MTQPELKRRRRKGSTSRRSSKRSAILDGALEVTAKRGLSQLSLATVADHAGVSKALVVYHFGSMAALRIQMTHRVGERFAKLALGTAVEPDGSLEARALALLDAVFHPRNRTLFLAMHELLNIAPREPTVAATVRNVIEPAHKLVAAIIGGQDDPQALEAAGRAVAAVHGYISLWIWCGAGDPTAWRNDAERTARRILSEVAAGGGERDPAGTRTTRPHGR